VIVFTFLANIFLMSETDVSDHPKNPTNTKGFF